MESTKVCDDFDIVARFADRRGWKYPIHRSVPLRELAALVGSDDVATIKRRVSDAIISCTGSMPSLTVIGRRLHADAAGYHAAIGM